MTTEGHGDIVRERTLSGHQFGVIAVAVTPDGQRTVSGSWDKTLKLWDLVSGRELRTLSGHAGLVAGVAVTPDGQRAVSASGDNTLKVWDLARGASSAHSPATQVWSLGWRSPRMGSGQSLPRGT